ncbi:hypothetical protein KO491_09215 [Roseovarius nubinhibens]|uniref:hypothetical protein n=1 Tax=Roseovarius nubinhibens TaxID=314263 RepID=UPI001C08B441|nr:hypothetical protein [Roseovarius nubinhibens]MBU3000019.1 hypothetical protein [Roseovarius nubinhibens]
MKTAVLAVLLLLAPHSATAQAIFASAGDDCVEVYDADRCFTFDPFTEFWVVEANAYLHGVMEERFRGSGRRHEVAITASHLFHDRLEQWLLTSPMATRPDLRDAAKRLVAEIVNGGDFSAGLHPSRCVGVLPTVEPKRDETCP